MPLTSTNPTTGSTWRTYDEHTDGELELRLARAAATFQAWRKVPLAERAVRMRKAGELLKTERDRWARLMVEEMGKPFRAAQAEAEKCAWVCAHYAEQASTYLADEEVSTEATRSYVRYLPLGPVLAVMPWNFPFWQVFRFAAPALMAGNVGLLKHASNVPGCALAIEEIFRSAGFPEGAFQTLLVGSGRVARLIDDERVAAVTLTGSEHAGAEVAAQAGRRLKKTVLELGGSDPFIVMPSADLPTAAKTAVTARNINNGQSCIAAKRFIVHTAIYPKFERLFLEGLRALTVGDPMSEATDVGPLATRAIVEEVAAQVDDAVKKGARLLVGGRRGEGLGNFYPPTALTRLPRSARAFREEVFGPVALLFEVKSIDEAIALANDSPLGLASSVWTRDDGERRRFIDELETGITFVDGMVVSDPRLPFGGVKRSGYGRELGREGIRELVNVKTVVVKD
ncbi:MAG: NAD-dependent succinate-semialdehyde dehydrogenase [Myxococcota bacterium]